MKGKFPAKISFSMSMAIFGTIGVFTRLIPLSSSEIALYRAVLAAIVIALFLALSKKKVFQEIRLWSCCFSPGRPWGSIGFSSLKPTTILP